VLPEITIDKLGDFMNKVLQDKNKQSIDIMREEAEKLKSAQSIDIMREEAEKLKSAMPDFRFKFEAIIRLLDDVSYRQFNTKF